MTYPLDQPQPEPKHKAMPFLDHLDELRMRLLKSIIAIVVLSFAAFYFSDYLVKAIIYPLGDIKLYVTEVTGSFYAYLKISLVTGVVASLPVIFYQLWSFVGPGLYPNEKKTILPLVVVSTLLFLLGAGFCWFLMLPLALKFLIGFSGELFSPIITVNNYISFAGMLLLAFGFAFELPVVAYFLGKIGVINARFLAKGRRYAIVIILVASAIITPPDVFTQVMLGAPLYLLYEVSIIIVRMTQKKRAQREVESEAESEYDRLPPAG